MEMSLYDTMVTILEASDPSIVAERVRKSPPGERIELLHAIIESIWEAADDATKRQPKIVRPSNKP